MSSTVDSGFGGPVGCVGAGVCEADMAPNSHAPQGMRAFTIRALRIELLRSEAALIYKSCRQFGGTQCNQLR